MTSNIKLKTKAIHDLPEFIRDDYQTFAAFISCYHDWLDQNQANIKELSDIDTTLSEFVKHFKKEIDYYNITFPYVDERFLVKHLKKLYLSKGTEESYKTLFRLLFDKEVIIKYPYNSTLKSSDGKWIQIFSIFVEVQAGDPSSLENAIATVESSTIDRTIDLTIEKVKMRRTGGGVSTIYLSSGGTGYTNPTIEISGGNGTGAAAHAVVVGGVIESIVIDNPGTGYTTAPQINIVGDNTTPAAISTIRMYISPDVYELNIDRNYYGGIDIGDIVVLGDFRGKIIPTINSYEILDPGKNFSLGQTFTIDTFFGKGATVKVSKLVTGTKGIAELKFIRFGYGYLTDFDSGNLIPPNLSQSVATEGFTGFDGVFHEYSAADTDGGWVLSETYSISPQHSHVWAATTEYSVNDILKDNDSENYYKVTAVSGDAKTSGTSPTHTSGSASNGNVTLLWLDPELFSHDYVGTLAREFYSTNEYQGDPANGAKINFKLGAVCKYPGHYINSDGMVSDEIKLHDGFLYQKYSYILQADEKLETYKNIVKSLVHPAGMALFGEYSINTDISLNLKLTALLSIFSIRHADAVAILESQLEIDKDLEVSDDSNTLYGTQPDIAYAALTKIVHRITKDVEPDATDEVPTADADPTMHFVGNKYETVPLTEEVVRSSNTKLQSSIGLSDYIILIGDWGMIIPETINISSGVAKLLEIIAGDINDEVPVVDSGGVTLNVYLDQLNNYVSGDYVSAYDSTF